MSESTTKYFTGHDNYPDDPDGIESECHICGAECPTTGSWVEGDASGDWFLCRFHAEQRRQELIDTTQTDRFCDHGTPSGSWCGRCAALVEMTASSRLFATAAEQGVPPVPFHDGDLSRIEVTAPVTLDEYNRLHAELEAKRAERKAKRDRIEGTFGLDALRSL